MDTDHQPGAVTFGKGAPWVFAGLFLILIGVPAAWNTMQGGEGDARWMRVARQWAQAGLVALAREGNRKVLLVGNGELHYRPGLDALTGRGPMAWEPGNGPLAAIAAFGEQARALGVDLILVPIPGKEGMQPLKQPNLEIQGSETLPHADATEFYATLRSRGVEVWELDALEIDFLKQDSHWTPRSVELAAAFLAEQVRARPWFAGDAREQGALDLHEVAALGDLVETLDLPDRGRFFAPESALVHRVRGAVIDDIDSPVVLLGDSFANIYGDEELGFGSGASLAHHLAKELSVPLDVIAQNGGGTTGVRRTLAQRPGSAQRMRDRKKVIIWAIAERDLLFSEAQARANGVVWEDVEFQEGSAEVDAGGALVIEGTLAFRSGIEDPMKSTYRDALFAVEYRVDSVVSGGYEGHTVLVYLRAFHDRKLSEAAGYALGAKHRLTLQPFHTQSQLKSERIYNASDKFDLVPYWGEKVDAAAAPEMED